MRRIKRKNTSLKNLIIIFVISTLSLSVGYSLLFESLSIAGSGNLVINNDDPEISSKYLKFTYTTNYWYSGGKYYYQIDSFVENISDYTIENWKVVIYFEHDFEIIGIWNADAVKDGSKAVITAPTYNTTIPPHTTVNTVGLQIVTDSDVLKIEKIVLYGTPIGVEDDTTGEETPGSGETEGGNTEETPDLGENEGGNIDETPDSGENEGGNIEETPDSGENEGGNIEETPDSGETEGGNTGGEAPELGAIEATDGLNVSTLLRGEWLEGTEYMAQYEFKVTNTTDETIENWQVLIDLPEGVSVHQIWEGNYIAADNVLKLSGTTYNSTLAPNETAIVLIQFKSDYKGYDPQRIYE